MRRSLGRKILCSILAAGICGSASLALAANNGGETIIINDGWRDNLTYAGNNGTGNNNEVYFDTNDGNNGIDVIGGYAVSGDANSNYVTVNGTDVRSIDGGYAKDGDATYNSVTVKGAESGGVYGGYTEQGDATYNSVIISDGSYVTSEIHGGYASKGSANYNSVIVNDSIAFKIYGGQADNGADYNSLAVHNSKIINDIYGGFTNEGSANNNSVVISDSIADKTAVAHFICGGYVQNANGTANNNNVVISDSTVYGSVVGGHAGDGGTADNNSVTIVGNSNLTDAKLYGKNNGATGTGNKLILSGFSGGDKTVKSLNNFDSIEVKSLDKNENYTVGDTTTVIKTTDGIGKSFVGEASQTALIGVAKEAEGTVKIDGNDVKFTIGDIRASKQTASTTEARAGVTAFVNQGAEVVADNLNMLSQSAEGINTFATVSGNNSKYDTGSYADINGWNSIIGIANTKEIGNDKLNYGAFFENGSGNYNTYNEIGGAGFRGDGNVLYNGGGVMVRLDKENGFYTEAAVRAGSVKNEAGKNLSDGQHIYDYETENAYYGGHIGIGKIFQLDNGKAWDVYGKYFHMHHEGDSVEIGKDTFDFDSVDSNKLRIGARFSEQQGEKLTSYYGLAWDYEFSGDVSGTAAGYDMHSPSLEGSTVIGEVGFRYTPGKESPWYFDANVKGYVGMQEGLSGSVQAVYSF